MTPRPSALAVALALAACGGAGAATPPAQRASSGNEPLRETADAPAPAAPHAPLQSCELPYPHGISVTLEADPALVRLDHMGPDCVAIPAHEEPLEWMASFRVAEREGLPEAPHDPSEPVVARGTVELLGAQRPWTAIHEELPFVGPAEIREALVPLTSHDLDVVIGFADTLPEHARASAMALLATLRVHTPIATDALAFDARHPVCRGMDADTGLALTVTAPDDAQLEPHWVGVCALYAGEDGEHADWMLTIGPVPSSSDADALRDAPDGVQRALVGAPPEAPIALEGSLTWLGEATHWYAAEIDVEGTRRLVAMTRAHARGHTWYATLTLLPTLRAELPRLLAVLETAHVIE